ncbi:MAG: SRPBCC family protein [Planctomycetota bacterium]
MPTIEIQTSIHAPAARVFDLCRSVDAHIATAASTQERPVGGVVTGLLGLGDEVTWSARHLGIRWRLTSRITEYDRPHRFRDSMVSGVFARFDHDHEFENDGETTQVRDVFDFASPWAVLGRIADALVVTRHMRQFLARRMKDIKQIAESDAWSLYVPAVEGSAADHLSGRG